MTKFWRKRQIVTFWGSKCRWFLGNVVWRFLSLSSPKGRFSWRFLIFGRFYPIFASFLKKIIHFPTYFPPVGQVFWLFFHKKPIFWNNQTLVLLTFFPYLMLGVFEDHCRLKMAFWKKSSGHTGFGRNSRPPIASQWAAVRITTEACRRKNPQITPDLLAALVVEYYLARNKYEGYLESKRLIESW